MTPSDLLIDLPFVALTTAAKPWIDSGEEGGAILIVREGVGRRGVAEDYWLVGSMDVERLHRGSHTMTNRGDVHPYIVCE
jgi:hypothetical protein